jgi:protein SCO1
MEQQEKTGPVWIALVAIAIVIGSVLLIKPIKTAGIFANKFALKPQIGRFMPLDVKLTDSDGQDKQFGEYLRSNRPVMVLPIFYNCNGVCASELDSVTKMLTKEVAVSTKKTSDAVVPGRDFDIVIVSVHPKETVQLASAKKAEIMNVFQDGLKYFPPSQEEELIATLKKGIHFTVGKPDEVLRLTEAMGFYYTYNEKNDWVDHPAAAAYVSTSGLIIGYNTGSNFATKMVRASVTDAKSGKQEPLGDPILLGCFRMQQTSPTTRAIVQIINIGCVLTVFTIGIFIWRWNRSHPSNSILKGGS